MDGPASALVSAGYSQFNCILLTASGMDGTTSYDNTMLISLNLLNQQLTVHIDILTME